MIHRQTTDILRTNDRQTTDKPNRQKDGQTRLYIGVLSVCPLSGVCLSVRVQECAR